MEAACESARHAVNAILDHYVWVGSGGGDRREKTILNWRCRSASSIRASRARFVCRHRPAITAMCSTSRTESPSKLVRCATSTRSTAWRRSPIRWICRVPANPGRPPFPVPSTPGGQPMTSPLDRPAALLAHLHAWRQHLEQTVGPGATQYCAARRGGCPLAAAGQAPFDAAAEPAAGTPSTDYTQQLLAYLQAWRQYLEHMAGAAAPRQPPGAPAAGRRSRMCQGGAPPPPGLPPPPARRRHSPGAAARPSAATHARPAPEVGPWCQGTVVITSHIAQLHGTRHPEGEPFPGSGSRLHRAARTSHRRPMVEYQPN